jgi:hypothetical protein
MALLKDPHRRVATGFSFMIVSTLLPIFMLSLLTIIGGVGLVILFGNQEFAHGPRRGEPREAPFEHEHAPPPGDERRHPADEPNEHEHELPLVLQWQDYLTEHGPAAGMALLVAIGLTGYLLSMVGLFLCLAVPTESRAGSLITLTVALAVISFGIWATRYLAFLWPGVAAWRETTDLIVVGLFVVEKGFFVWFIRRLGDYLGRPEPGQAIVAAVRCFVIAVLIAFALGTLYVVGEALGAFSAVPSLMIASCIVFSVVGLIVAVISYVYYVLSLVRTRRALRLPV